MLFLITLIYCSIAVGMFIVVLNIIVHLIMGIANNTEREIPWLRRIMLRLNMNIRCKSTTKMII